MSAASYAGIPLALLAATAYNAGLVVEKRALGQMPALDLRRVPQVIAGLLASRTWLGGFALMLIGLACQVIVLTFEPVSVVQPVLACGVALVPVMSRLVLRERLRGTEIWCVAVIIAAMVLLALSTSGTSTQVSHHADAARMAAVMISSVVVGAAVAALSLRRRTGEHGAPAAAVGCGVGTGLLYGVAVLAIKALSGILVGHHTAASLAIALVSSPYLYALAGSLLAGMLAFQAALQACRASIVVPVSAVTGSGYVVIAASWLFNEHLPASADGLALRLAGIALALLGLVALSRQAPDPGLSQAAVGARTAPGDLADVRRP
jgi:drug/metabolite transporter (DMT)-like permease